MGGIVFLLGAILFRQALIGVLDVQPRCRDSPPGNTPSLPLDPTLVVERAAFPTGCGEEVELLGRTGKDGDDGWGRRVRLREVRTEGRTEGPSGSGGESGKDESLLLGVD